MNYAIVDIETTGSYAGANNITEIAIIIHDGKQILDKFQSLIRPKSPIPYYIQQLTGISNEMVADAPTFSDLASQVYDLLADTIFVAHNVNFDYSFVEKEFQHAGFAWKAPKLCTVRLARKIIPNQPSYSLGKLCQNLRIKNNARHRAMGDAAATAQLFELLVARDTENFIQTSIEKHKPKPLQLPGHIEEADFLNLPETVGVYHYIDQDNNVIYVGQAPNLRKKVLSYFTGSASSKQKLALINATKHIAFERSGTALMASLLAYKHIQKYTPKYNPKRKQLELNLATIESPRKDFIILDRGRTAEEQSYIYFKDGQVYAFGFVDCNYQYHSIEDLIGSKDRFVGDDQTTSLVLQYAEQFPSKVFPIV